MKFREFKVEDSDFCFRTRSNAYVKLFYEELGAERVALCVNSILPNDFVKMSLSIKIFIVEDQNEKVGFFTFKKVHNKVEIPLIYFNTSQTRKGYGSKSMKFIEEWVKANWKDTTHIYLDTIIPKYNGKFYEKMGYKNNGKSSCEFLGRKIEAVRFEKQL